MSTLRVGQRIRLLHASHPVAAGTEGTLIGFYARETRTVVVRFTAATIELEPDAIEVIEPAPHPQPPAPS